MVDEGTEHGTESVRGLDLACRPLEKIKMCGEGIEHGTESIRRMDSACSSLHKIKMGGEGTEHGIGRLMVQVLVQAVIPLSLIHI